MSAGQPFTPAEIRDLGTVAARARMLRDDIAPMVGTTWREGERIEEVIPWRLALEIED